MSVGSKRFDNFWECILIISIKLLVFSVTQFKIDKNKNQNRSVD